MENRWGGYRFRYQEELVPANKMLVERWLPSLFIRAETDCDSSLAPSKYIQIYEMHTSTFEYTEKPIIYSVTPRDLSDKTVSNACSRPWNLVLWRQVILPTLCGVGWSNYLLLSHIMPIGNRSLAENLMCSAKARLRLRKRLAILATAFDDRTNQGYLHRRGDQWRP